MKKCIFKLRFKIVFQCNAQIFQFKKMLYKKDLHQHSQHKTLYKALLLK